MTEVAKSVTGGAPADERSRVNEQETLKKCFYCAHVAVSVVLYLSLHINSKRVRGLLKNI